MARVKTPEEVLTLVIKGITDRHREHITPDDPNFAEFLAKRIEEINHLKGRLRELQQQEVKLKKEYDAGVKVLRSRADDIHNTCPHYSKTYHGDPSGGSDSHEACDICGKRFD